MSVASQEFWNVFRRVARGSGVSALVLFAACGGERQESPGAGTEGASIGDTAPAPAADTAAPATGDTTAQKPADTAAKDTAAAVATREPATKPPSKPPAAPAKPKAQPDRPTPDTAAVAPDTQVAGQTETATAPLRDAYHQAPKDTVDQATYDGWKQYNLNCARCHGEDVLGSTIAPHLIMSMKPNGPVNTQELFVQIVCAGRPARGMPSWCALGMEPAKINQIYSYVKGRSDGKIGPGRPAVKAEGSS